MNIGIVDYGSGNLRSVQKALAACGAQAVLFHDPARLDAFDGVVVPGVGAFGDAARNLRRTGLWDPLKEWIRADRPYLGICLGYQLLFESSEESPGAEGLGIFEGAVRRFPAGPLKVPHMGWNTLDIRRADDRLYAGLPEPVCVYFVHSFYPAPADSTLISAVCDYAVPFAASISRGTLSATQFHPEKSQRTGLAILRNFLAAIQSRAQRDSLPCLSSELPGNPKSEIQNSHAAPARH